MCVSKFKIGLIVLVLLVVMLVGCVNIQGKFSLEDEVKNMLESGVVQVNIVQVEGKIDEVVLVLKVVVSCFFVDKMFWLCIVQICFDVGDYSDVIVNVQEVFKCDFVDKVVNSIVIVFGLCLVIKLLGDLCL